MQLGAFSLSLNVSNIEASLEFYSKLGFSEVFGDVEQGWLILRNDSCTLGLFRGMIERNTLTFNPGWDQNAEAKEDFLDIRDIQKKLEQAGINPLSPVDPASTGPANLIVVDPDGNPVLLDQHVDKR